MAVSYNNLLELLNNKNMDKSTLCEKTKIRNRALTSLQIEKWSRCLFWENMYGAGV